MPLPRPTERLECKLDKRRRIVKVRARQHPFDAARARYAYLGGFMHLGAALFPPALLRAGVRAVHRGAKVRRALLSVRGFRRKVRGVRKIQQIAGRARASLCGA